jgi:hypothetical protein
MTETQTPSPPPRISSSLIITLFLALALSFLALIYGLSILAQDYETASIFLILGFLGVALSTYVLFVTRRRLSKLRIEVPPVTTTIECKKCGFKNVREFQRGDYILKEDGQCQKCNEKMLITAIYREIKEKQREKEAF